MPVLVGVWVIVPDAVLEGVGVWVIVPDAVLDAVFVPVPVAVWEGVPVLVGV